MNGAPLSGIEQLLARLPSAKPRGHGRWIALCPVHDDKNPSLSITETQDGIILLRCWAGCGIDEIVRAVGLALSDLFPRNRDAHCRGSIPVHLRWNPWDVLASVAHEALIVSLAAGDLADGELLSSSDGERVDLARRRLEAASKAVSS